MQVTTIQLNKETVNKLKKVKDSPRQTYDEVVEHLISIYIVVKKKNTYDEFLHKIQQPKMKELWDNKEDEAWENV